MCVQVPLSVMQLPKKTQRQTHILVVFSEALISHATFYKAQRNSLPGCVFFISHVTPSKDRDRLTNWMFFRSSHQSSNFPGNTRDRLTPWMWVQVLSSAMQLVRKQRKTHSLFSGPLISYATFQKKNKDRLTLWMCFQIPWLVIIC